MAFFIEKNLSYRHRRRWGIETIRALQKAYNSNKDIEEADGKVVKMGKDMIERWTSKVSIHNLGHKKAYIFGKKDRIEDNMDESKEIAAVVNEISWLYFDQLIVYSLKNFRNYVQFLLFFTNNYFSFSSAANLVLRFFKILDEWQFFIIDWRELL